MRSQLIVSVIVLMLLTACGGASAAQNFAQQHTQCNPIYYYAPRWSPDGKRIAFTMSDDSGMKSIYLDMIDLATLAYTRLAVFVNGVEVGSWSPDSSRLVVSAAGRTDIYVIDTAIGAQGSRAITGNTTHYFGPDWSPDGKRLALTTDRDGYRAIVIVTLNDAIIRDGIDRGAPYPEIQDLTDEIGPVKGEAPRWSPDGGRIAYFSPQSLAIPRMYVINSDGTGKVEVTSDKSLIISLSWSPDGTQIAYSIGGIGRSSIYIINADGKNNKYLTVGSMPDYSPDGKRIVFVDSDSNGFDEIYVMNLDGTGKLQLTHNPANGICLH